MKLKKFKMNLFISVDSAYKTHYLTSVSKAELEKDMRSKLPDIKDYKILKQRTITILETI